MTSMNPQLPCSLVGMLGRSSLSEEELSNLRRKAWWEQGLLIVHPWDMRLSPEEAKALNQIAERLYGGERP
ncbi:MAG: hypothetical protein ACJAQT_000059 [Akkermansiaceae bacterium]|jgi:hypothetical protein